MYSDFKCSFVDPKIASPSDIVLATTSLMESHDIRMFSRIGERIDNFGNLENTF